MLFYVFFFKQKTAYEMRISDWSSDVCSSDLWQNLAVSTKRSKVLVLIVVNNSNDFSLFNYVEARLKKESGSVSLSPLFNTNSPLHSNVSGLSSSAPAAQIGRASCRESVCQYV